MEKKLGIVGIPIETGNSSNGFNRAPDFIRENDLSSKIEKLGYTVSDYGDLDVLNVTEDSDIYNINLPRTFKQNTFQCKQAIEKTLRDNNILVVLGGDRAICTGSILGHSTIDKDFCIIFVGRKPCLHTPISSKSGNMNEMPLFLLISEMQDEIPWMSEFKSIIPNVSAKNMAFIGLNGVDNYEKYMINKYGFKAMSVADIDRLGVQAVIEEIIMTINPQLEKYIHLCFNVDVFDPMYGPSSAESTLGGLTLRETIAINEYLFNTGKLRVLDVMEFNPKLGSKKDNEVTRISITEIILAAVGSKRCGNPNIDPQYYAWEKRHVRRALKLKR